MEHLFNVNVNDMFEFKVDQEKIQNLDIQKTSSGHHHLLINNKSVTSEVVSSDFLNRVYTIKINSNTYQVKISSSLDVLIKDMGLSLSANQVINEVKAPMPGMILDIMIKEGQEIKEGDALLVLEAMKMENTILAPRDATIKAIQIQKNTTVGKNEVLIELE